MLAVLQQNNGEPGKARGRSRARNAPKFDGCAYLFGMSGVDLRRINGNDTTTALKAISQVGTAMSRFESISCRGWASVRKRRFPALKPSRDQASAPSIGGPGITSGRRNTTKRSILVGRLLSSLCSALSIIAPTPQKLTSSHLKTVVSPHFAALGTYGYLIPLACLNKCLYCILTGD